MKTNRSTFLHEMKNLGDKFQDVASKTRKIQRAMTAARAGKWSKGFNLLLRHGLHLFVPLGFAAVCRPFASLQHR